MRVVCRVPGCNRELANALGESRHVSAMHPTTTLPPVQPVAPVVNTVCIESGDEQDATGTLRMECGVSVGGSDGGSGIGNVVGLESEVFLALAKTVTAPFDASTRRGGTRRGAPPESARRARLGGHSRSRASRRGRRASRHRAPAAGSAEDDGYTADATGDEISEPPGGRVDGGTGEAGEGSPWGGDSAMCNQVFQLYERYGDSTRATTAFPVPPGGKGDAEGSAPWTKDGLWHVFVNACTASNGFGLSQNGLRAQYFYTKKVEAATCASKRPFTDTFRTANRFIAAIRRFKRAVIAPLHWRRVPIEIDGTKYVVCFRDALEAAQEELLRADPGDLFWGITPTDQQGVGGSADAEGGSSSAPPAGPGTDGAEPSLLRGVWDGEMFKEQAAHVRGTMPEGTKVLGLHIYSDATVLSRSGAVSAYPLRMRVVNVNSSGATVRWVTIAYIPQVAGKFLDTRKGQEVRSELLQRVLHLAFRSAIQASHTGAWLDLPDGGQMHVSPRALLYVCDQPEERAVMCLKAVGCLYPCTPCKVGREFSCFAEGATAPARDLKETVGAQLRNATTSRFWGSQARRAEVELAHSLNSVVPALAAWAGLGNGPRMLYRLPGFDRLHVCFFPLSCLWLIAAVRGVSLPHWWHRQQNSDVYCLIL